MNTISYKDVIVIHDRVIQPHELQGVAKDKSIESVIARIDNRLAYGFINDPFELAASYAVCIAQGHAFNDANKRTAFASMVTVLDFNEIEVEWDAIEAAKIIIEAAQGNRDEKQLAHWLREQFYRK